MRTIFTVGALAYFDTFSAGLVPCVVTAIKTTDYGPRLTIKVLAPRKTYRRGEVVSDLMPNDVVPRSFVRRMRSMFGPRIIGGYTWRAE